MLTYVYRYDLTMLLIGDGFCILRSLASQGMMSICHYQILYFFPQTDALHPEYILAAGIFFMVYLLSHSISIKIRQVLILFCEIHFTLLYILQLNLISNMLERCGSLIQMILSQSGINFVGF